MERSTRRAVVLGSSGIALGLVAAACRSRGGVTTAAAAASTPPPAADPGLDRSAALAKAAPNETPEVTAVEDLMREHGVLRRALIVYRECSARLRAGTAVAPEAIQRTAALFRSFGEDYHERQIEEAFVLPAVQRAGGLAASLVPVILAQHQRGREITEFLIATSRGARVQAAADVTHALDEFAHMYEAHTAREDTIVFPAWKATLKPAQYDEMGDKFEAIERQTFGKDGFDDAVQQMNGIEAQLGLADLAGFTAPPPPTKPGAPSR